VVRKLGVSAIDLTRGWNYIGFTVEMSTFPTASDLLGSPNYPDLYAIARWQSGGWTVFVDGFPFNNFTFEPGQGYVVLNMGSSQTITIPGEPFTVDIPFYVCPGWHLRTFPGMTGTASDLGALFDGQIPDLCQFIAGRNSGNNDWLVWDNHPPTADFQIRSGASYMVYCQDSGVVFAPAPQAINEPSPISMPNTYTPLPSPTPSPTPNGSNVPSFFIRSEDGRETNVEWTPNPAEPGQYGDFSENTNIVFKIDNYTPAPNDFVLIWEDTNGRQLRPAIPAPDFRYQPYYYDSSAGGDDVSVQPPETPGPDDVLTGYPGTFTIPESGELVLDLQSHSFTSFPLYDGIHCDNELDNFSDPGGQAPRAQAPSAGLIQAYYPRTGQTFLLNIPQWVNYRNDIEPVSNITVDWLEARVKAIRSDDDLNHAFPWIGSNYVAIWNDDLTHDNANFYRYRSIRGRVASEPLSKPLSADLC
jgi:hypothetical protein